LRSVAAIVSSVVVAMAIGCGAPKRAVLTPGDIERLRLGGMMSWPPADQRLAYPNIEKLGNTALVRRSGKPSTLAKARRDLGQFRYSYKGTSRSVDEFMSELKVVGVIGLKDGAIAFERYADGHDRGTPWTAFSVTKSVTSLLFGVAIKNGHISSLDEPVTRYVPELAGSAYDDVSLRHLLQMSSGVEWNSNLADKTSDTYKLAGIDRDGGLAALLKFMAGKKRVAPPGQKFTYNTADADIASTVLSRATKRTLSEILSESIWQPFGMEGDAHWLKLRGGDLEHGDCCLSATLRDNARLGLVALNDGVAPDGVRRLPEGWMRESTRSSPAFPGYGYFWWLRKSGSYYGSGSFGQHIEVDPATRTVVAIQSYWPAAYNDELISHNDTFVAALIDAMR
jgi:CubicO group peptidase (beta-lactamase class C family)